MSDKLIQSRKKAEAAVKDMPDGPLKVKAFEVFLSHLLSGAQSGHHVEKRTRKHNGKSVDVEKPTKNGNSVVGRILSLKEAHFFKTPKTLAQIKEELGANGWIYPRTTLTQPTLTIVQKRLLRRTKTGSGKKKIWAYVNP